MDSTNSDHALQHSLQSKQDTIHNEHAETNGTRANADRPSWLLHDTPIENQRPMKVIVIGAGYSGIYLGIRIPERIRNCELVIYEKNAGVGGTWYENRYPGKGQIPVCRPGSAKLMMPCRCCLRYPLAFVSILVQPKG